MKKEQLQVGKRSHCFRFLVKGFQECCIHIPQVLNIRNITGGIAQTCIIGIHTSRHIQAHHGCKRRHVFIIASQGQVCAARHRIGIHCLVQHSDIGRRSTDRFDFRGRDGAHAILRRYTEVAGLVTLGLIPGGIAEVTGQLGDSSVRAVDRTIQGTAQQGRRIQLRGAQGQVFQTIRRVGQVHQVAPGDIRRRHALALRTAGIADLGLVRLSAIRIYQRDLQAAVCRHGGIDRRNLRPAGNGQPGKGRRAQHRRRHEQQQRHRYDPLPQFGQRLFICSYSFLCFRHFSAPPGYSAAIVLAG